MNIIKTLGSRKINITFGRGLPWPMSAGLGLVVAGALVVAAVFVPFLMLAFAAAFLVAGLAGQVHIKEMEPKPEENKIEPATSPADFAAKFEAPAKREPPAEEMEPIESDTHPLLGRHVEWKSQAGGNWKVKNGVIVAIVPARGRPENYVPAGMKLDGPGMRREHESYLVLVGKDATHKGKLYWPRVADLRGIEVK